MLDEIEKVITKKLCELFFSGCTVGEAYASLGAFTSRQKSAAQAIANSSGFTSIESMRSECLEAGRASVKVKLMQTIQNATTPSEIQKISDRIHGETQSYDVNIQYSDELLGEAVRYLTENSTSEAMIIEDSFDE